MELDGENKQMLHKKCTRYVIDIIGTDPLSLGDLGGVNSEKLKKNEVFLT